ncbi:MAG TPA: PIN domain-containing protein [Conexivisphaerales archaeon]|nr:PIN domain-containing protein [Conexivisphaerales archaeon]
MSFDLAFIVPSSKSVARAALTAKKLGIAVYDAVYLELAADIGCQLVTADEELAVKARGTALISLL